MNERLAAMVCGAVSAFRRLAACAAFGLLITTIAGCESHTVNDVCKKWADKACPGWKGVTECTSAGNGAEDTAKAAGCDAEFDAYLKCVNETNNCHWAAACAEQRSAVTSCAGDIF